MSFIVNRFTAAPEVLPLKEVCRYMGLRSDALDYDTESRICQILPRFLREINCRACWMEVPVSISDNLIDMDVVTMESRNLSSNLAGCDSAIIFAATIGSGADRLCKSASVSAPLNALIYDAMGSTAIEWFCDALCDMISGTYTAYSLCPRFSPGYGDLSLTLQTDLLRLLDAQRYIGLTLSESLMMIPQKSVTAIIGLKPNNNNKEVKL